MKTFLGQFFSVTVASGQRFLENIRNLLCQIEIPRRPCLILPIFGLCVSGQVRLILWAATSRPENSRVWRKIPSSSLSLFKILTGSPSKASLFLW